MEPQKACNPKRLGLGAAAVCWDACVAHALARGAAGSAPALEQSLLVLARGLVHLQLPLLRFLYLAWCHFWWSAALGAAC